MTNQEAIERIEQHMRIHFAAEYPHAVYITEALNLAIEALKEREAIKPYIDYDGQDVWRCGKCGNSLMHPSYYESDDDAKHHIRYCSHCGKAVKWDEM